MTTAIAMETSKGELELALALGLVLLASFVVMNLMGVNANIMSLGGIAIAVGAMVPGAVVMIENMHRHLEDADPDDDRWEIAIAAAKEVGPSLFFSLLIIAVSFIQFRGFRKRVHYG